MTSIGAGLSSIDYLVRVPIGAAAIEIDAAVRDFVIVEPNLFDLVEKAKIAFEIRQSAGRQLQQT